MYKEIINLGKGLGRNKVSFVASFLLAIAVLSPSAIVYAASSPYGFTMAFSVVNGCSAGILHTLDAGTGKISGSASAPGSSLSINYNLQREVFGPNPSFGSVNGGINTSFSNLAFGTAVTSNSDYCLVISRSGFDSITVNGSGTLHN